MAQAGRLPFCLFCNGHFLYYLYMIGFSEPMWPTYNHYFIHIHYSTNEIHMKFLIFV